MKPSAIQSAVLFFGTGIFFLLMLSTAVYGQYSMELGELVGEGVCPAATYYANQVYQENPLLFWQKDYPAYEFGYWGAGWPLSCNRSLSADRDSHHPVLECLNYPVCDQKTPTASFAQYSLGGYTYFYAFPDMKIRGDYLFNFLPLQFRTNRYYDFPFRIYRCKDGSCIRVAEYNTQEYYSPEAIGSTDLVNDSFPDLWGENYRKNFEQFTIKKFEGTVQGTQLQFCWEIEKYSHFGSREDCGWGCSTAMHVSNPSTEFLDACDTLTVPCNAPGAACASPLQCNPASGACVQCTENSNCGTGQVCDTGTNTCVEVCPSECSGYNPDNFTCGTLPPTCCSDPLAGCTTPKPACASQNIPKGTACATGGVCNPATWQCECPTTPINCRISPNDVACGDPLVPAACLPHSSVCQSYWQGFTIGWKCNDIDTRCANNPGASGNNIKCWSPDEINCGTTVAPFSGVPAQVHGLYCDAFSDERHGLCDSGSDNCLSVVQGAAVPSDLPNLYPPKFRFDVGVDPDSALWYNLWFKFRFSENPGESFPQIDSSGAEGSKTGLYCFNCSVQPDPVSAFKINYDSAASKEGLIRFNIQNRQLFGPNNYARIKIFDRVNPGKTSGIVPLSDSSKADYAILKLDAGSSGECVSEDRQFIGKTGPSVVPSVKLAWNWSAIDVNSCVSNAASGFFCDSTQFLMSVIDRLENNYQFEARNTGSPLAYDFNANLIKDGFSTDFLLDFDHYMMGVNFYDTPQSYKDNWHKYLQEPLHLHFQVIGQSSAQRLDSPGKYAVHIDRGSANSFFTPLGEPAADVIITLEKLLDPDPPHPLYWVAFDGSVGAVKRQGETVIGRDNYGSHFAGDVLAISDTVAGYSQGNALSSFNAEAKTTFLQTNEISQRGKLFELALPNGSTPGTAVVSSVSATPVAMKIVSLNNSGQGFFLLRQTNQDVSVPVDQSIGSWSGIAGSPNACRGFNNQPPLFLKADEAPNDTACTANADSRGFLWSGTSEDEKAVLESVLYGPANQSMVLVRQCQVGTSYFSPDSFLPAENSQSALPLGYSQTKEWNTNTLTQIVDLVKEGKVCQFVGSQNDLHYFWNRKALLDELPNASHWPDFAESGDVEFCGSAP